MQAKMDGFAAAVQAGHRTLQACFHLYNYTQYAWGFMQTKDGFEI